MKSVDERYAELLQRSLAGDGASSVLVAARALGAELDEKGVPRAAMEEIHAGALRRLAELAPRASLAEVAPHAAELMLEIGRGFEAARRRRRSEGAEEEDVPSGFADDDFLALLTHELRTPLSPILTWAELLRAETMDAEQSASALGAIERNARALQAMIDDLSVAARSASGRLSHSPERVDLAPLVAEVADGFRDEADGKGVQLATACDASLPVMGESRRLRQIVRNLVGNAVKFTSRGERVEVEASVAGDRVRLVVGDSGRGLGPAELSRIFDRVWPVSRSITRRHRGLGLGLAVVRRLVDVHGGTIVAESGGDGRGARFVVELPLAASPVGDESDTRPEASPSDLTGVRVLVVDDEPDAIEAASALLRHWGAEVCTVTSAEEALAAVASFEPHVLLSDLAMPRHDGYALLVALRDGESRNGSPRLPAIALTAHSQEKERRKAIHAGFDAVVAKPIESGELLATLGVLVAGR